MRGTSHRAETSMCNLLRGEHGVGRKVARSSCRSLMYFQSLTGVLKTLNCNVHGAMREDLPSRGAFYDYDSVR